MVIGEEEGGFYKLKGHLQTTHIHETTRSSELWHRNITHINHKAIPYVRKVVKVLLYLKIHHDRTCKGCARGKNIKNPFLKSETNTEDMLELNHFDVFGPIPSTYLSGY